MLNTAVGGISFSSQGREVYCPSCETHLTFPARARIAGTLSGVLVMALVFFFISWVVGIHQLGDYGLLAVLAVTMPLWWWIEALVVRNFHILIPDRDARFLFLCDLMLVVFAVAVFFIEFDFLSNGGFSAWRSPA
jgi:hypothetical protein